MVLWTVAHAWLLLSYPGHCWALPGESASQAHGDCGAVSLCRHQIWLLCVYFFVQRDEKPFNLWQKELLCVSLLQIFAFSLYTASKDGTTSFATHFSCRSSLLSHAVMVSLTPHTTILSCLCSGLLF